MNIKSYDRNKKRILGLIVALSILFPIGAVAVAGDDPSIQGDLRKDIQAGMETFIDRNTIDGVYYIYDPVEGKMMELTFKELHKGIVKKGAFYVSCADFTDSRGRTIDLDFLVIPAGDKPRAIQAIVHSVDGKKRKYHLEN